MDLTKVRIQGATKNTWNGVLLTRISMLTSVESVSSEGGTIMEVLPKATAPNLTTMTYELPPPDCCISQFRALRNRLNHPFRLTVKGKVVDVQAMEMSTGGNPKRVFDIVDKSGVYFTCCAMKHNAESKALINNHDVVLYYGTGRGPIGGVKGILYLLKDALIVPLGTSGWMTPAKTEQLSIQ